MSQFGSETPNARVPSGPRHPNVPRSQIRKHAHLTQPVDVAQELIEAQEIIDAMSRYMRWTLPGQEEGCDSRTRERLLARAEAWKAALDD